MNGKKTMGKNAQPGMQIFLCFRLPGTPLHVLGGTLGCGPLYSQHVRGPPKIDFEREFLIKVSERVRQLSHCTCQLLSR